jgi:ribosomal protein S18 acetylase RimI-like enzyme
MASADDAETPHVRPAVPADIPRLGPIEEAADRIFIDAGHPEFSGSISDDDDAAAAIAAGSITVVEVDSIVEGWVQVGRLEDELCIDQISVNPEMHGQGLGTRLMRHVMAMALDMGEESITLDTQSDVPWNQPWYEQLGFVVVPKAEWSVAMASVDERQTGFGLDWERRVHMRWKS